MKQTLAQSFRSDLRVGEAVQQLFDVLVEYGVKLDGVPLPCPLLHHDQRR